MDALKLSSQFCFKVYALQRQITALYRPFLTDIGLTYPQYLVMMVLWEHKEVSVKELGELLLLDSGTLTPLLKRMEEAELVSRTRSKADERIVCISLTEKGIELKEKAAAIPYKMRACLDVSDQEFREFMNMTEQVLQCTMNEGLNQKI
jgi:MarR family transcriptional regulator, organic hydroperoxide resistance regulator